MDPTVPSGYRPVTPEQKHRPAFSFREIKWAPSVIRLTYGKLKESLWREREVFHVASDNHDLEQKALSLANMEQIQAQMTAIENEWEKNGFSL
jgi:hypothetical protein